ncbi:hypothetical protein psal_cds_586 [Pandoravirus salinus]|uniref:Uncharacterized protein n=1 Tax=Pandoravirus salinus TaxID=1349410 RepID=A0A291ATT9_9VIRU|nr:hypothetical protein psal_cds_586 [Pandoravirus salinus]ATE82198.1 hypothetical protein psal_cds_586 [Pandoravirus salinus]
MMRTGTSQTPIRDAPLVSYGPLLASSRGGHIEAPRLPPGQAAPWYARPYVPVPSPRLPAIRRRLGTAARTAQASAADAWRQRWQSEAPGADTTTSLVSSIFQERSVSPNASQPQYEESVPTDVQYQIMRLLAEAAPEDALRLAAADRAQRLLLQSIPARVLGLPAGFSARAGDAHDSTGIDYVRSLVALGAGTGPQAVALAQALCVMQAFARLLLDDDQYQSLVVRYDRRTHLMALKRSRNVAPDASILDVSGVIEPHTGRPIDLGLVRDWYLWVMSEDDSEFTAAAGGSPLWLRLQRATGGGGRGDYSPTSMPNMLAERLASGDALGIGPPRPIIRPLTVVKDLTERQLLDTFNAYAGPSTGIHLTDDDINWREPLDNPDSPFAAALASPEAERAFKAYLDDQVAARHKGPCRAFETATGLSLPPFTSLFDVDLYVMRRRGMPWRIIASVRSPRIESLLASAGAWPPARA